MSRNGSGVYTLNTAGQPVVAGTTITATAFNAATADIATALTQSICTDGQTTTTGLIPFALGLKTDILSPYTALGPISVSAGQLQFPASQNASANVNTLDDYEEGTFTPTLTFGGGSVGMNPVTQAGNYTKIGNRVLFDAYFSLSVVGSSTGNAVLGGLPFTTANLTGSFRTAAILVDGMTAGVTAPVAAILPSSTSINLYQLTTGGLVFLNQASFTTTSIIAINGSYMV